MEDVFNFSASPLSDEVRDHAERRFRNIINNFANDDPEPHKYNRPKLVQLIHEFSAPGISKDNVLRAFFRAMELPLDGPPLDFSESTSMRVHLVRFADHLVDQLFLPLVASARSPLPSALEYASPTTHSESQECAEVSRLSELRNNCLIRDKHRCAISRVFDRDAAIKGRRGSIQTVDDDGEPITPGDYGYLVVTYILPCSLFKIESKSSQMDESRKIVLQLLNMLDNGVVDLINSVEIDRPRNALALSQDMYHEFKQFHVYFIADNTSPHTYRIETFYPSIHPRFPITRTFSPTQDRTREPPSARLLAVHRAIAHILRLSGAGDYIYGILGSIEETTARADGSTPLGELVRLRIEKWLTI